MSEEPLIWLDGEPATSLPLPDRGFSFGDGLFETLLVKRGIPLFIDYHLERLRCGVDMLGLSVREGLPDQIQGIATTLVERGWDWASLRVTVSRGSGPRGYLPPQDTLARVVVEASVLDRDCSRLLPPAKVDLASIRLSHQPALAGLKHLNRLEQVIASREASLAQVDELLMLDTAENVVSVVAGNLFLRRGDQLTTPPIQLCGVAGTRRRLIIERWAKACGLAINVEHLGQRDIASADELFLSNSLVTVRAIGQVQGRALSDHGAVTAIFEEFRRESA